MTDEAAIERRYLLFITGRWLIVGPVGEAWVALRRIGEEIAAWQ